MKIKHYCFFLLMLFTGCSGTIPEYFFVGRVADFSVSSGGDFFTDLAKVKLDNGKTVSMVNCILSLETGCRVYRVSNPNGWDGYKDGIFITEQETKKYPGIYK